MNGPLIHCFERYRMVRCLTSPLPSEPPLPLEYHPVSWDFDSLLLRRAAHVIWSSFRGTTDTVVLPLLATPEGCLQTMRAIAQHRHFLPFATWLIRCSSDRFATCRSSDGPSTDSQLATRTVHDGTERSLTQRVFRTTWVTMENSSSIPSPEPDPNEYCATIQALYDPVRHCAAIQNVAVLPDHRRRGLATWLLWRAARSCQILGFDRITLEATVGNTPAIRLYVENGFRVEQTILRSVPTSCTKPI